MKAECSLFASPLAKVLRSMPPRRTRRVQRVSDGLLRGGAPTERELRGLAARGVRQVIDLRKPHEVDGNEAALCKKLGLEYLSVPMGQSLPSFAMVEQLLAGMSSLPTYVHCQFGCDRSGAVVALYRTVIQGWSLRRAGVELLSHGFDVRLDRLASDVCYYTHELQRTPGSLHLHQRAAA